MGDPLVTASRAPSAVRAASAAPDTWIVTDGVAGNLRQAQALVQALGLPARPFTVRLSPPWRWFAPHLRAGLARALPRDLVAAARDTPPQLVIGCGRQAAAVTAWLKATHRTFAVQILDPRGDANAWDLVITPAHDRARGDNVILTTGALHAITPARLAAAALESPALAEFATPRTAVLIGGSTRAQRLDTKWVEGLFRHLSAWQSRENGSFLVTMSRRTPAGLVRRLREGFARWPGVFWAPGDSAPNPYPAMLAHAQRIVVSPDSVNLLSEACATGRPVFTHAPRRVSGKLSRLHDALISGNHLRPLSDEPGTWQARPLRETEGLAAAVWERYRRLRR
jgi:uncharacterized protein